MNLDAEWLETDGRGGFASGTVGGDRSRRYHALLLTAAGPNGARMVLVNGVEVWLETPAGRFGLSTQRYPGGADGQDVLAPRGRDYLIDFQTAPWPRWTFQIPDGPRVEQEIFVHRATGVTAMSWRLPAPAAGCRLELRPLFSGRDYHALHHENGAFASAPVEQAAGGANARWQPYAGVPGVRAWTSGVYRHEPAWYRRFLYRRERERGLDDEEDLAVPGVFVCDLARNGAAALLLVATPIDGSSAVPDAAPLPAGGNAGNLLTALRADEERRRSIFREPLSRAGDAYLIGGAHGSTIIAGYPWFTDWGRDTFIALRGLCLATGRFADARDILLRWIDALSDGMLPNRFPDGGAEPEYNTADASLWFIIATHDYLAHVPKPTEGVALERFSREQMTLLATCEAILAAHVNGTRYGIRLDPEDGLLCAGEPGGTTALTWMDARVNDRPINPRVGKPVEIQALWLNALALMAPHCDHWHEKFNLGRASFATKFWNPETGYLNDVVDCNGVAGQIDASVRPNALFAVGGLPLVLLSPADAGAVVARAERDLLTPAGLRTLAPGEAGYRGTYAGDPASRDRAYHEGTAWAWLFGPFVEAWVRVNGDDPGARAAARERFLAPLLAALPGNVGLGHAPEIADGDAPHAPRGCPFQAWSVGELTRLAFWVLKEKQD